MIFEPLLNTHKIKYSILEPIINANIKDGKKLSIYINLDSILKSFYTVKNNTEIMYTHDNSVSYISLSSEIINIAAHYKAFFIKKYRIMPDIYFYYNKGRTAYNESIVEGYNSSAESRKSESNMKYKYISIWINKNIELVKVLSKYIPGVYFLDMTKYEESIAPCYLIDLQQNDTDRKHIIITKDINDYQCLQYDNTYILRLKYDDTYMVTRETMYNDIIGKDGKVLAEEANDKLSPQLLPLILSIAGLRSRSIKGIPRLGYKTIVKKLIQAVETVRLPNTYITDIVNACEVLGIEKHVRTVAKNYSVLSLKELNRLMKDDIELMFLGYMVDRYDNETLMKINSESYPTNPMDLLNLCMEVRSHVRKW